MFTRLGSMLAPLVISLSDFYDFLPLTIMGFLVLSECFLIIPLQETKGIVLPETIEDVDSPIK